MARPPMNDTITLHQTIYDENGQPKKTAHGQEMRQTIQSKARVKYTDKVTYSATGEETSAVLELRIPSETTIHSGDIVEWIDRSGKKVREPLGEIDEVLNYAGTVVYYRKALAGKR